jgi:hypothetical protein
MTCLHLFIYHHLSSLRSVWPRAWGNFHPCASLAPSSLSSFPLTLHLYTTSPMILAASL